AHRPIVYGVYRFRILGQHRPFVHLDNVVYISKITRIITCTIDHGAFMLHELHNELRYNSGIGAIRILTTTENVKITQSDSFHSVGLREYFGIKLVYILGNSVWR